MEESNGFIIQSGEFLLSGVGPLHLEVTAYEIGKKGVS
ncbi:unnamed protein product, partial [marine sediment metagenome]